MVLSQQVLNWCWDHTIPSEGCDTPHGCREHASRTFRKQTTTLVWAHSFLRPYTHIDWERLNVCSKCEALAVKAHAKGRQSAWDELPSVFRLKAWESA